MEHLRKEKFHYQNDKRFNWRIFFFLFCLFQLVFLYTPLQFDFFCFGMDDTEPPFIVGHIPKRMAVNISISQKLQFYIRDELTGVDSSGIRLTINGVAVSPQLSGSLNEIVVTYNQLWNYNDSIQIKIEARDLATPPNVMEPDVYYFKTKTDYAPPLLFDRQPVAGISGVSPFTTVCFKLADTPAGIDSNTIKIYVNEERPQNIKIIGDSSLYEITIEPSVPFQYNQNVKIRVSATDLVDPPNVLNFAEWKFTTERSLDSIPPFSTGHFPGRFASNISLSQSVSVEIVDEIKGVDSSAIKMWINSDAVLPQISGTPARYKASYQTLSPFNFNDTVWVRIQAADLADPVNVMRDDAYYFLTQVDTNPPYVTDLSPRDNTTQVNPESQISFFLRDEVAGINRSSIQVSLNGERVSPEIKGDSSNYSILIRPERAFNFGQTVTIKIEAVDLSHPPNHMEPGWFSFTIQDSYPDLMLNNLSLNPDTHIKINQDVQVCAEIQLRNLSLFHEFYFSLFQNNQEIAGSDSLLHGFGSDTTLTICKTLQFPKGEYYLKGIIDSRDNIAEANEVNNIAEIHFQVIEGDLQVKPNPFTPNGDGYNDAARFDISQLNLTQPVLKIFSFDSFKKFTIEQRTSEYFLWNGRDMAGNEMPPGIYLYLLEDGMKTIAKGYVVLAR